MHPVRTHIFEDRSNVGCEKHDVRKTIAALLRLKIHFGHFVALFFVQKADVCQKTQKSWGLVESKVRALSAGRVMRKRIRDQPLDRPNEEFQFEKMTKRMTKRCSLWCGERYSEVWEFGGRWNCWNSRIQMMTNFWMTCLWRTCTTGFETIARKSKPTRSAVGELTFQRLRGKSSGAGQTDRNRIETERCLCERNSVSTAVKLFHCKISERLHAFSANPGARWAAVHKLEMLAQALTLWEWLKTFFCSDAEAARARKSSSTNLKHFESLLKFQNSRLNSYASDGIGRLLTFDEHWL